MSKPPGGTARVAVNSAIDTAFQVACRTMRIAAQTELDRLHQAAPETLTLALVVEVLLRAQFDQQELAKLLGVSRTTISRWAQGQNIPRSPGFREWAIGALRAYLRDSINAGVEPIPNRISASPDFRRRLRRA
jgi:transcriptional regulator with XRE-family HTH domain